MGKTSDKPGPAQSPSHKRQPDDVGTRASRHQSREPKLPHERDESGDSQQQPKPDARVEQAASDVKKGLVDTSLAPVTEELAREHFPPKADDETRRR